MHINADPCDTILIVDDEPASRRAVTRALSDAYRVCVAADATEALAILAAETVAVVIADQRMPGLTGVELLQRCMTQQPDVVRVLLTGYTDIDTVIAAINGGHVYAYVAKPWQVHELQLAVQRAVEHAAAKAERRRLLQQLEHACARWRRESEQKERLLALAAHELGTPLHLLGNALALLAEVSLGGGACPWLDTARRSTEWLARGVAQLARGGRGLSGTLTLHCVVLDPGALLTELRDAYAPAAAARRLALHASIPAGLPRLRADRRWLLRALSNLLSNAVRFTPDGGRIELRARADTAAVHIEVADTGIGIDAALLPEVFEPFSAATGDVGLHTSGRFEFGARGLGLGLAITRAVIVQHGGQIAVRSASGDGSCFSITLPRQE